MGSNNSKVTTRAVPDYGSYNSPTPASGNSNTAAGYSDRDYYGNSSYSSPRPISGNSNAVGYSTSNAGYYGNSSYYNPYLNRPSNSTKNYYQETRRVYDFSPYIDTSDIGRVIRQTNPGYEDRLLLQEARALVARESDWIFRNCEIRVIGPEIDYILSAGTPSNVYVITKQNNQVDTLCKSKSLRMTMRDGGRKVWGWLCDTASSVVGAIQNTAVSTVRAILPAPDQQ